MALKWKRVIERSLAATPVPDLLQRWQMPSTVVLAYHNIVPTGDRVAGDAALHVDQSVFGAQLDLLQSTHTVIPLNDFSNPGHAVDGRPRAIITFDDAYAGALSAGVEELVIRGLPATFFVTPGLLAGEGFWWDRLNHHRLGEVRDYCLRTLQGRQDRVLEWADSRGVSADPLPPHARPGDHAELRRVATNPFLSFGAHTWSHPNLAALAHSEVVAELTRPREWLREQGLRYTNWIAYPYGLFNSRVTTAAAAADFDGAFLISGGLAQTKGRRAPAHSLPRVNVGRLLTLDGLRLRLAGLLD